MLLDYPVNTVPRWPMSRPHPLLWAIFDENRSHYAELLRSFLQFEANFLSIGAEADPNNPSRPHWSNDWMPALDGVALYSFLAQRRPKVYLEVGSGNSTKFAKQAILDHNLATKIISIDPAPRAEVDRLCDRVYRQPLEAVDPAVMDCLEKDDILYIDSSHRSFTNSDVTVFFLEILPRLKPGVVVEIHDITLPYDYPATLNRSFYNEQYLLACYLLAKGSTFKVLFPSYFTSYESDLASIMSNLWSNGQFKAAGTHGCSFWLEKQ